MIENFSFGNIVVNGITYTNDIKIIQGKVIPSWWRKKGHKVSIDDIQDIIDAGPESIPQRPQVLQVLVHAPGGDLEHGAEDVVGVEDVGLLVIPLPGIAEDRDESTDEGTA